jgi:DNA-nicking Smr family endonuclease
VNGETSRPRRRSRAVSAAERSLWHAAVREATPLPGREKPPPPPPVEVPSPKPDPVPTAPTATQRQPPGLDRRSADRLKRGRMKIDARIDLHGMTQVAAHDALLGFVARAIERDLRVLLVITGKGEGPEGGVLRRGVPRWLAEPPVRGHILSTVLAQPQHGGDGAVYVLLRRRRA